MPHVGLQLTMHTKKKAPKECGHVYKLVTNEAHWLEVERDLQEGRGCTQHPSPKSFMSCNIGYPKVQEWTSGTDNCGLNGLLNWDLLQTQLYSSAHCFIYYQLFKLDF
ncbi:hypothetical protein EK904_007351 [Melospiza melodia maxima]|nr:hypothetical protein EK904_007351 [Melospiza melodia maxima]